MARLWFSVSRAPHAASSRFPGPPRHVQNRCPHRFARRGLVDRGAASGVGSRRLSRRSHRHRSGAGARAGQAPGGGEGCLAEGDGAAVLPPHRRELARGRRCPGGVRAVARLRHAGARRRQPRHPIDDDESHREAPSVLVPEGAAVDRHRGAPLELRQRARHRLLQQHRRARRPIAHGRTAESGQRLRGSYWCGSRFPDRHRWGAG